MPKDVIGEYMDARTRLARLLEDQHGLPNGTAQRLFDLIRAEQTVTITAGGLGAAYALIAPDIEALCDYIEDQAPPPAPPTTLGGLIEALQAAMLKGGAPANTPVRMRTCYREPNLIADDYGADIADAWYDSGNEIVFLDEAGI